MLSSVLYFLIQNIVCIDYLSQQSKNLSIISSNIILEQTSFNILLGVGIPDLSLNLVSCYGFIEKPNSTVLINCRHCLANNYLSKGLFIIKNNYRELITLPDNMKLIIRITDAE